jgi:hypothetical protein
LAALAAGVAVLLPSPDAGAQPPKGNGKAQAKPGVLPGGDALKKRVALEGVNEAPAWAVRVSVDRDDRTYQPGDLITVEVVSEQPGFLYLFNVDAAGENTLLFPNGAQKENTIAGNTPVKVPGPGAGFNLRVTSTNTGVEYMKAIVAKEPIAELKDAVANARGNGPIVLKPGQYERVLREVALRGNKDKVADSGNPTRDVAKLRRDVLKSGGVAVEQVNKVAGSWAEHQVEIYTGPKGGVQPPAGGGRRVALLVGISKFGSPSIRPLGCADKDAKDLAAALRPKFNDVQLLTDSQATLSGIRAAFSKLVEGTRPGDTVLVYWAGHGGRCANTDGTEPDGFDEYLVPYDGSLASDAEIKATMLMDKAFGRWVQELDGRKVLVVLDTCHSGGQVAGMKPPRNVALVNGTPRGARGVNTPGLDPNGKWTEKHMLSSELNRYRELRSRNIRKSDAAVLCSAGPKEFAFEMQDGSNGVMTHFVLEYIQSNPTGVTLQKVAEYVTPRVQAYVGQNYPGSPQTPVFSDETPWTPLALIP